jgi:hypothetical protein
MNTTTKFATLIAGAAMLAVSGVSNATETLSDTEMDGVNGGALALALAGSVAYGDIISNTAAYTQTGVNDFAPTPGLFAAAEAKSQGVAVSALFQAASQSVSAVLVQK